MPEHQLTELESGVRVVSEALPHVRSISLGFWVGTGSRDEERAQAGISHFLEHMLFKGTDRFSAAEIAAIFDGMGAEINAFTSKEQTVLHCRFLDEHLGRAFEVTSDMLLRPAWHEYETEREVILEEIAMYEDEPQDKVHDVLSGAIFGDHPLGRPVIGTTEVISGLPVKTMAGYHGRRYVPRNVVVAAAGNLAHEQLVALVQSVLEASRDGAVGRAKSAPQKPVPRTVFQQKDTEQYHLCLGAPGLARGDERRFAMSILDSVLGGSVSSRLFQEVREKRGLAYSVYSFANQYGDTGQLGVYVGTRADNVAEAMGIIGHELSRLVDDPASPEELARAKENLKGRLVLSMESTAARMNRLGRSVLGEVELLSLDQTIERIEAVQIEDLKALAGEFYVPARWSAAAIGPEEGRVRAALGPVNEELAAA